MVRSGGRATRARFAVVGLAASVVLAPGPARAADPDGTDLSRAHDAYARGASAFAQGDYARAARELAVADALVPAPVTLRAALEAVTLADDPILGTELIERAARSPLDPTLAHALAVAQARFAHRTAALTVRCDGCLALVDGNPARAGVRQIVLPGVHQVTVQKRGAAEPRLVTVAADESRDVLVDSPVDAPAAAPADGRAATVPSDPGAGRPARASSERGGVSPVWFVAASVATVALGAVTVWSAVDTASVHSDFQTRGCAVAAVAGCSELQSSGQSAQSRTTWLAVGTGALATGTTLLGALGVHWAHPAGREVSVSASPRGASLRVSF
jgi:hypothetical protein